MIVMAVYRQRNAKAARTSSSKESMGHAANVLMVLEKFQLMEFKNARNAQSSTSHANSTMKFASTICSQAK